MPPRHLVVATTRHMSTLTNVIIGFNFTKRVHLRRSWNVNLVSIFAFNYVLPHDFEKKKNGLEIIIVTRIILFFSFFFLYLFAFTPPYTTEPSKNRTLKELPPLSSKYWSSFQQASVMLLLISLLVWWLWVLSAVTWLTWPHTALSM